MSRYLIFLVTLFTNETEFFEFNIIATANYSRKALKVENGPIPQIFKKQRRHCKGKVRGAPGISFDKIMFSWLVQARHRMILNECNYR